MKFKREPNGRLSEREKDIIKKLFYKKGRNAGNAWRALRRYYDFGRCPSEATVRKVMQFDAGKKPFTLDNGQTTILSMLACIDDERKIQAHKVVLSSCSTYFKDIFKENPHPHPVIIFKFIKFEDLNAIIEFMYQGEVNVHQYALQSFLQTAELLAVQGLTAEEKEKPKAPTTLLIDDKLIRTIPSTIRTISEAGSVQTSTTQTIEIPATILQHVPQQMQQQTTQTTGTAQQQTPQHHSVQTQIQHIQIQHQPQVQQQTTHHIHNHQQQQQQQQQQNQQHTQLAPTTTTTTNVVSLPATSNLKKRKITFSDYDDNIYTAETVNFVKDEQTIVKTGEMSFEVKMDMPEYIVSECMRMEMF